MWVRRMGLALLPISLVAALCDPADRGVPEDDITRECQDRCGVTQPCTDLYATVEDCESTCVGWYDNLAPYGERCVEAQDAESRCVADLSCAEVNEFLDPSTSNYPCQSSFSVYVQECYFDGAYSGQCTAYCDTTLACANPPQVDWPLCMAQCGAPVRDANFAGNTTCVAALNDQYTCVAALECAEYQAWLDGGPEYPCQPETELATAACG